MKQFRLLCALCLFACLAIPARADDASKREKIHQMFALVHLDQTIQQLTDTQMKQVTAITKQLSGSQKLPPETQAKLDDFQKRVFDLVSSELSWSKLEPEYTDLYMQTYTEQELDDIIAFYRSPSGASMIAKQPELLSKSMAIGQQSAQRMMPQLMQMIQDLAKQLPVSSSAAASGAATRKP